MQRPDLAEIVKAFYGTLLLLRGQRRGVSFFSATPAGALRSFWSFLLTVPVWIWASETAGEPVKLEGLGVVSLQLQALIICVTIISVLFTYLVMERLTRRIGVRAHFPLYVTVQNWVGSFVLLALFLISVAIPPEWNHRFSLLTNALSLVLSWFLTLATLRTSPFLSLGLTVLVDLSQKMAWILCGLFFVLLLRLLQGLVPA